MAWNSEKYILERELPDHKAGTIDLFGHRQVSNKQLLKMWKRELKIYGLVYYLWRCNRLLPGWRTHEIDLRFNDNHYAHIGNLLARTKAHIAFTSEEEKKGYQALNEMGITGNEPFICFNSRDGAYLGELDPGRDWSYHDFRDSKIDNYMLAAEEMSKRGYYSLRLGSAVKEPLRTENPSIIDYSTLHRTEFMDIFLLAKCRFLIGTNTGITDVADILRKPVVKTNVSQFYAEIPLCTNKDLFIPKKLLLKKERRLMTFRELVVADIWKVADGGKFELAGVELIENNPEEIRDIAIEMDERLNGTWQTTREDEELQGRFWEILNEHTKYKINAESRGRIGACFLRQNKALLV